ncbi:MAG TPA: UbiD family decarboxylase [Candidatus Binataceae bacterium]|nr:UbiD family decarboxylase [Candidatus Binataceae bacterium]
MVKQGFFDLRTALDLLDAKHELTEVTGEVDWDLELGAVTREVFRRRGPALLYTNIKDYNTPGARCRKLAAGLMGSYRRLSMMLGFDDVQPNRALIDHLIERNRTLIAPVVVNDGPVHEHVLTGKDIDLYDFPAPRWHHLDGGRYIGTLGCAVMKDPETGQQNVGIYRSRIVDRDKLSTYIISSQNWRVIREKYQALGRPIPVAWVFGWDPVMELVAGSPFAREICEYDVMGGYRGAPVPLVKCCTVDLMVPAAAELVVEGEISLDPATYALEGPFGEVTGHVSGVPEPRPVTQVSAITHRDQPIFRGTAASSMPGAVGEYAYMSAIQRAAIAWETLRTAGIPGILDLFVHPVNNGMTVVVQIRKLYEGQPKQIAAALWGVASGRTVGKYVIVVDEDIDPSNYEAIDWAINYRVDPGSDDMVIFRSIFGWSLDPGTAPERRNLAELGEGLWNRLLIDATKTWRFPRRPEWNNEKFPPVVVNRPEDIERVRVNWPNYKFTDWKVDF